MSMRSRWYETLDYIKSNDPCMYKMALYILNDDEYLAIEFLKSKFGFRSANCHRIFLEIKIPNTIFLKKIFFSMPLTIHTIPKVCMSISYSFWV